MCSWVDLTTNTNQMPIGTIMKEGRLSWCGHGAQHLHDD